MKIYVIQNKICKHGVTSSVSYVTEIKLYFKDYSLKFLTKRDLKEKKSFLSKFQQTHKIACRVSRRSSG